MRCGARAAAARPRRLKGRAGERGGRLRAAAQRAANQKTANYPAFCIGPCLADTVHGPSPGGRTSRVFKPFLGYQGRLGTQCRARSCAVGARGGERSGAPGDMGLSSNALAEAGICCECRFPGPLQRTS